MIGWFFIIGMDPRVLGAMYVMYLRIIFRSATYENEHFKTNIYAIHELPLPNILIQHTVYKFY
jgi:hypothetical protein